jgi:beta-1,4-mannosyl-glycoprotein beta-1,4-N-acetylglucosaminyltransferase
MQLKKRIVALACFLVFLLVNFNHIALNVAGLTRPVWEKPPKEFQIITHYHAPNVSMDILCKRHGWVTIPKKRVVDAILFSVELDLLEVR